MGQILAQDQFEIGRLSLRLAQTAQDLDAVQALRFHAFLDPLGQRPQGRDADEFDAQSQHVMVCDRATGAVMATARVTLHLEGLSIERGYSGQFYHLEALAAQALPILELGRFCVRPQVMDPDVLRLAWAYIARLSVQSGAGYVIGCSSFKGIDPQPYEEALSLLWQNHQGPISLRAQKKAPEIYAFAEPLGARAIDRRRALGQLPPLLRSYLLMGAWVSDHAVIDRALGTLHVFTCLSTGALPTQRLDALRQIAEASLCDRA